MTQASAGSGSRRACFFVDSSTLAQIFVKEAGTDFARRLHAPGAGHVLASTRIAPIELAAAIGRRARSGDVDAAAALAIAKSALDVVEARYVVQDITPAVALLASQLVGRHGLAAVQALQLAAARELARARADLDVTFVSTDSALLTAARAESLPLVDPTVQS